MGELSIGGLRVLRAVFDTGSFTSAGDLLGYTQSSISRQVASIEKSAGVSLFLRGARGVSPTAAGVILAGRAATALHELDAAAREINLLEHRLVGNVVIGAFPTAATALVPRAIALMGSAHPHVSVELDESSSPTQLKKLRAGRIDVAVLALGTGLVDYDLDGLRSDVLPQGELLVAVHDRHHLSRRQRVPVNELIEEIWIAGKGARDDPQFGAWPTLVDPHIGHRVREWPARLGFVASGLGICVLPELAATSVPTGVATIRVEDRGWSGRLLQIVTLEHRSPATISTVDSLQRAMVDIQGRLHS